MIYALIVCIHEDSNGIGKNNRLLYRLKGEMKYFKNNTILTNDKNKFNAVIMGYNTWISIPLKFRPLPYRMNIIITKNHYKQVDEEIKNNNMENTYMFPDIQQARLFLESKSNIETCFIIGGESIYNTFISENLIEKYYITKIMNEITYDCDSFFPKIDYNNLKKIDNDVVISEKDCLEVFTGDKKEVFYKFCIYEKI